MKPKSGDVLEAIPENGKFKQFITVLSIVAELTDGWLVMGYRSTPWKVFGRRKYFVKK